MASSDGVVGKYGHQDPNAASAGYADGAGDNPHNGGVPTNSDLTANTGAGFSGLSGGPAGYWTRPVGYSGGPSNPNSGGIGNMGGVDPNGAAADVLANRQPRDASDPGATGLNADEGFGPSGNGRS